MASTPIRHLARVYTAPLYAGRNLDRPFFTSLKSESERIINYLFSQPIILRRLIGPTKVLSLRSLARPIATTTTDSIETEFRWTSLVLIRHASHLNSFVAFQEQFDKSLLLGRFQDARSQLQSIQQEHGHSLWSINAQLLLEEEEFGLTGNRATLAEIHEQGEAFWVRILSSLISERVERTLCPDDFDMRCDMLCQPRERDKGASRAMAVYLMYRLNRARFTDKHVDPILLSVEEGHSLIDRLCTYKYVARRLVMQLKDGTEPSFVDSLHKVAAVIHDRSLLLSNVLASPAKIPSSLMLPGLNDAIDAYTTGQYGRAVDLTAALIGARPDVFELYELLSKSTVRLGRQLPACLPPDCLAESVLKGVFALQSRSADMIQSHYALRKLSYRLEGTEIGTSLQAFVAQSSGVTTPAEEHSNWLLAATAPTPRLSMGLASNRRKERYLTGLQKEVPKNAAIELFLDVARSDLAILKSGSDSIPASRRLRYCALLLESQKDFYGSLAIYNDIARAEQSEGDGAINTLHRRLRCLIQSDQVVECVQVLARSRSRQPLLLPRDTLRRLLSETRPDIRKTLKCTLEWVALAGMAHRDGLKHLPSDEMYGILDDFLSSRKLLKPSELLAIAEEIDTPTLTYVMRFICVLEVLDSSPWFDSLSDLENERLTICEWLTENDHDHRSQYVDEIAGLRRVAAMRELASKSGHSKVFVDTGQIAEHLTEPFRDRVTRCLTYLHDVSDVLRKALKIMGVSVGNIRRAPVRFEDAGSELFKSIFNDVTQQFLFSNEWGLDSNLSQRIRHGTLSGEIRAIFDKRRLITQKDASGDYLSNTHWLERLSNIDDPYFEAVAHILEELSQSVDDTVADVRNVWVQIKSQSRPDGFFDYQFDDSEMQALVLGAMDSELEEDLIANIFESLWEKTDVNLARLRKAITVDLASRLDGILDKAVESLAGIPVSGSLAEFRDAVTTTKTQIQYTLADIAYWFHVDHPERTSDFQVDALVDAVVDTVNKYAGYSQIEVSKQINAESPVQGKYFRGLWDLLLFTLTNCAQHSQMDPTQVSVEIHATTSTLAIEVSNRLGPGVDLSSLEQACRSRSAKLEEFADPRVFRGEGGTGVFKLHKILRFDMNCRNYHVTYRVEGSSHHATVIANLE